MNVRRHKHIALELAWLVGIFIVAVSIEYAFFEFIDINPILSLKIQGLIGLLFVGYGLRASYRVWEMFQEKSDPRDNGMPGTKLDPGNQ